MTRDEHNEIIEKLANSIQPHNDDGSVAVLLSKLQDDYTELTARSADLEAITKDLTDKNEKLRAGNMELLLSRGTQIKSDINTPPTVSEEDSISLPPLDELAKQY